MIGSHVKMPQYQQSIDEYQSIINTSQNQDEIYYATLEKLRTIELMLDSLLNKQGGDNFGNNKYTYQELSLILNSILYYDLSGTNQKNIDVNTKTIENKNKNNDVKTLESTNKTKNNLRDKSLDIRRINNDDKKLVSKSVRYYDKQNYINKIKNNFNIENINLSKLKNDELINLISKVVNIKLIEKSLLSYTPVSRPLFRMKKDKNRNILKNNISSNIPKEYKLSQNYPNPFNPITKIDYDLPKDGKVKLVIYDILGREVKILLNNEVKQAGRYTIEFNGNTLASGIYFYQIQVEGGKGFVSVKKMVLLK
jgi:hypothetical protein